MLIFMVSLLSLSHLCTCPISEFYAFACYDSSYCLFTSTYRTPLKFSHKPDLVVVNSPTVAYLRKMLISYLFLKDTCWFAFVL